MNTAAVSSSSTKAGKLSTRITDAFPSCGLAHLPTPLEKMGNLSKELSVNLFIKRDDQTGLAFGGNKARKLDLIVADALAQGCDSVITWAGIQSNWCRQTAAAARRMGIRPVLVLFRRPNLPADVDGNYFVDLLFDAEITIVEVASDKNILELREVSDIIDDIAERERKEGHKAYIAPIGGSLTEGSMSQPLGAISYVTAFTEMVEQAGDLNTEPDYVVLASGSGSTHAGLMAGAQLLSPNTKVVGISVSADAAALSTSVATIANETLNALGAVGDLTESVIVFDEYNKDGYGILNAETVRALSLVAETEGILLDPVYTGKAMAGLLDLVERGYFEAGESVVFLHSGGTPALFPYRNEILSYLEVGPA